MVISKFDKHSERKQLIKKKHISMLFAALMLIAALCDSTYDGGTQILFTGVVNQPV